MEWLDLCSLKPLCSGMGEVVPARTSPTLPPLSPHAMLYYPVSKCPSASLVVTSTLRVKLGCLIYIASACLDQNVGLCDEL